MRTGRFGAARLRASGGRDGRRALALVDGAGYVLAGAPFVAGYVAGRARRFELRRGARE